MAKYFWNGYLFLEMKHLTDNLLNMNQDKNISFIQLTDTHLFESADATLLGVNTTKSFQAVIDELLTQQPKFDAILATGDISQDHSKASYQKFERMIGPLKMPCYWLPGNHDNKLNMSAIGSATQIKPDTHLLIGKHWQAILLDSQVANVPYGSLTQAQLEFLDQKLTEHDERYALILLHHHPILIDSAWIDQHALKNRDAFWQVLDKHPKVKAVLCGHVHQDNELWRGDIQIITSPSTCIQFKPRCQDFTTDTLAPGWRHLTLCHNGKINTRVHRIKRNDFVADPNTSGY